MCMGIFGAKFYVFALTFTFLFHYALSLIIEQKVEFFTKICNLFTSFLHIALTIYISIICDYLWHHIMNKSEC